MNLEKELYSADKERHDASDNKVNPDIHDRNTNVFISFVWESTLVHCADNIYQFI